MTISQINKLEKTHSTPTTMNSREMLNIASNGTMYKSSVSVRRGRVRMNRNNSNNNNSPSGNRAYRQRTAKLESEEEFYDWLFRETYGGLDNKEDLEMNFIISTVAKKIRESEESKGEEVAYYFYVTLFGNGDLKALGHALAAGILPDSEAVISYGFSCECFSMLRKIANHSAVQRLGWWPDACINLLEDMDKCKCEAFNEKEPLSDFYEAEYWRLYNQLLDTLASTSPSGEKWPSENAVSVVEMIRIVERRWKMGLPNYEEKVEYLNHVASCGDLVSVWKFIRDNWGDQTIFPDLALDAACHHGHKKVFHFLHNTLGILPKVDLEKTMLRVLKSGHKEIFSELHKNPKIQEHLQWESIWKSLVRACVYIGDWESFESLMKGGEQFINHENQDYFVGLAVWHVECHKFDRFIHFVRRAQLVRRVEAWWGRAFRAIFKELLSRKWKPTRKALVENSLIKILRENREDPLWRGWEEDYKALIKVALKYRHGKLVKRLTRYHEFAAKSGWDKIYKGMLKKLERKETLKGRWKEAVTNAKCDRERLRKFIAERETNTN